MPEKLLNIETWRPSTKCSCCPLLVDLLWSGEGFHRNWSLLSIVRLLSKKKRQRNARHCVRDLRLHSGGKLADHNHIVITLSAMYVSHQWEDGTSDVIIIFLALSYHHLSWFAFMLWAFLFAQLHFSLAVFAFFSLPQHFAHAKPERSLGIFHHEVQRNH